jgi:hypothetical protein
MDAQEQGIPLRTVATLGIVALAAIAIGLWYYFRSLSRAVLSERPIEVAEVAADEAALARASARVERARAERGEAALSEEEANRVLFFEALAEPEVAVRLELAAPYVRIALCERDAATGRWLDARLLAAPYPTEGGIAFDVRSGSVGAVSISRQEGEWVRKRIERQIAAELASQPRLRGLLAGLRGVRVEKTALVLSFR